MQVVDNDQTELSAGTGQPPCVGTQFTCREAGRVVDVQRYVAQFFDGLGQSRPLFVREFAGAKVRLVDATDRTNDAYRELGRTHFHGEHGDGQTFIQRDVFCDVDCQRRLAHRRARGQHDHVACLKARCHAVKVNKAGRHTRDVVRVVGHFGHAIEQFDHQGIHTLESLFHARTFLADVEDFLLGFVEDLVDSLALCVEGVGRDFVAGRNQLTQDRTLANNLGVPPDVACARNILSERIQINKAADFVGLAKILQVLVDSDHVRRLARIDERADRRIDQLVLIAIEVVINQQIAHPVPGVVVEQQTSEHARLRFDGMWWDAQLRDLTVRGIVFGVRKNSGHGASNWNGMLRLRLLMRPRTTLCMCCASAVQKPVHSG